MEKQTTSSPEEDKARRERRNNLTSQGILLIEDELPDRSKIRLYLHEEFGESKVTAASSMEAAIDHLINLNAGMSPPSVIILDLFLYFPKVGDMPDIVVDQLMVKYFSVPLVRRGVENNKAAKIVLGRLGVLSCLVDVIKNLGRQFPVPKLILYTQLFKYCKRYDRAFGYSIYEVKHQDREPKIEKVDSNSEFRCGKKHGEALEAIRNCIWERIKGIECDSGIRLSVVEKPYNYIQKTNSREFVNETNNSLMNLGDTIETLLTDQGNT